jgi:hypothetical protein
MMEGSDEGSTCPLKCCKRGEGGVTERHEWGSVGGIRRCQCPVCRCPCNKLMYASDWQRIGLAQLRKSRLGSNESTGEEQLSQFLGQTMFAAHQALRDVRHIGDKQGWELQSQSQQFQENVFNAAAAEHVVRQSGNLGSNAIQLMQNRFGRQTTVTLPGGQQFDTNFITANSDAHVRNNRIAGASNANSGTAQLPPGMTDRLNPDYSTLSEPFCQAAKNPNNFSAAVDSFRNSFMNQPNMHSTSAVSASTAAASAAPASNAVMDSSYFDFVMTEDEQAQFAMQDSLESFEQNKYARLEDHGGKMPAQKQPDLVDLCNDGNTPVPNRIDPVQHPSTMSTIGTTYQLSSTQEGSALLSSFNAAGEQGMQRTSSSSAVDKQKRRRNNALEGFAKIEKINSSHMHNHKDPKSLTKTEKAQRKAAKKRKKQILELKKQGPDHIEDAMRDMIGPGDITLSQGVLDASPNTMIFRYDNTWKSDSESEEED